MAASSPSPVAARYSERLWFGPLGWAGVLGFAGVLAIALLPVSATAAVVAGALTLVLGLVAATAWAARVEVVDGELRAGRARVPLAVVGPVRPLDAEAARVELGPRLDARAYVCLRAWARTAVRVELEDPVDPTPYWVVSTRHPERLAAAITAGRGRPATRDL